MPNPALDAFRAALLADPALQAQLAPLYDPDRFVAQAIDEATALGIALAADTLHRGLLGDPLDMGRFGRPINTVRWPGRDWLPIALDATEAEPVVDWAHFAGMRLDLPFFEEARRGARALPLNRLLRCRTPLSALYEASAAAPLERPDGLIFHMSRCGSTLVAQVLAADEATIMLSEPAPIDEAVQIATLDTRVPLEARIALLRAMVGAYGQDRFGTARRFVIKLDCWHALALPMFRAAFPETPWIFLYRDPVEVLVSHRRMPGSHVVPGMLELASDVVGGATMLGDEYAARMLARVCEAVLDHHALGGGRLLNYDALPAAIESEVLPHFGIVPNDGATRTAMAGASLRDAKAPYMLFEPDRAAKQADARDDLRALAEAFVTSPYRRLEALREQSS